MFQRIVTLIFIAAMIVFWLLAGLLILDGSHLASLIFGGLFSGCFVLGISTGMIDFD